MATPDDPTRAGAPAPPATTNSVAVRNATAGDKAPSAAEPALPATNAGRYAFGEVIARGGMGVVYRAVDTTLGREVAVKVLHEKFDATSAAARRFAGEARITAQLQHPAIPPVHDLGTLADGQPFLVMKLVMGQTLDALLAQRPDPGHDCARFVAAFEQVCQALAFAHTHGVIHRDLKPANVMVGSFGEVQVMDWGLAKVLGTRPAPADDPDQTRADTEIQSLRDSDAAFTQAGSVLGTPAFMPPEQAIGAVDQIDQRSDVFGLGSILCVILTGRGPFVRDTAEGTRQAAAKGNVKEAFARLDDCSADPELVALCKRCLAPEKDQRPADAGEVARAVAQLRAEADERARRSSEWRKRRRLVLAGGFVLAAAAVAGLSGVLLVQRRANTELAEKQAKVEKRFQLARQAVAALHTGVGEDLFLKSDQFKELRSQLLRQAADFYGDLEKLLEGETDANSRRLLADGYFQLAELTGKIGSKKEALAVHRKVLAMRRELAAAGADVETRLNVARSLNAVGLLWYALGDWKAALNTFAVQLDVAEELEAESPTNAVQAVLARSLANYARALKQDQKTVQALAASERAVAILRRLVDSGWDTNEFRYDLATSLFYSANYLDDVGRRAEAFAALENACAILRKLADTNPADTRFRDKLQDALTNMGFFLTWQGKPAEALAYHEKARVVAVKLARTHPAVGYFQWSLSGNFNETGRALAEMGKPVEAMAAYEKSLEIAKKLLEANPSDVWALYDLCETLNRVGDLYTQLGKPGDALSSHEMARALLAKPAESDPTYFAYLQRELATSLDKIGLLLSASGKSGDALAACRKAMAIRKRLSDAQPDVAWMREDLADSLGALGTVQRRAGQPAEAVASHRRAIALVEQSHTLTPRNYYSLACFHARLAGLAAEAGSGLTAEQGTADTNCAMAALHKAVAAGFGCVARLRTDDSLDTLRPREDFQKLQMELEAKISRSLEATSPPQTK